MAHSKTYEAIVLKAYDVGEADRFLILFTRERGKLSARARGVRKLTSRMGGHLLPCQHIAVNLTEGRAGMLVTGAQRKSDVHESALSSFLHSEQGIELLLALLPEDDPHPDIFDITLAFLQHCRCGSADPPLTFTLQLLAQLGIMPGLQHDEYASVLTDEERCFAQECAKGKWMDPSLLSPSSRRTIRTLCDQLIKNHIHRDLRAQHVAASFGSAIKT